MAENNDYQKALSEALSARADWLEKSELPKLKEGFRTFHTAFVALYNVFLKKGLINEDPYKNEVKIGELEVPETAAFADGDWKDQYSLRLASYDSQLDFLVNFYQFSVDFLSMEKIKRILGLVKFIDWVHLSNNSKSSNTKAMREIVNQAKVGADPLSLSLISESLFNLSKTTGSSFGYLKELTHYKREAFKFMVRTNVINLLAPSDAVSVSAIKKRFNGDMPGQPFYPDLVEEIIQEDSPTGQQLRENVLQQLLVPADKPKSGTQVISFKAILIDGLNSIGTTHRVLDEIGPKLDENAEVLANRKNSFWDTIKRLIQQMLNQEPQPAIYEVGYIDPVKGVPVKEKLDFLNFRSEMDRKIHTLKALASRSGGAFNKMQSMEEPQLLGMLEKNIRDVQVMHKVLSALDDFFKLEADKEDRNKIRGIKPELAIIKNAIVMANKKRHEYSSQKEEEEQLKRLGITS